MELAGVVRRLPGPDAGEPYDQVEWHSCDIGAPGAAGQLAEVFRGADAVVHLAWQIQPSHDQRVLRRTNVEGSRAVIDAVVRAGVPALVYASSVGTYAPGPKDHPISERWPTTGVPGSSYSQHKAEVEALLDGVERDHPTLRVVRMRPGLIFQRAAGAEITRYFSVRSRRCGCCVSVGSRWCRPTAGCGCRRCTPTTWLRRTPGRWWVMRAAPSTSPRTRCSPGAGGPALPRLDGAGRRAGAASGGGAELAGTVAAGRRGLGGAGSERPADVQRARGDRAGLAAQDQRADGAQGTLRRNGRRRSHGKPADVRRAQPARPPGSLLRAHPQARKPYDARPAG
ncbi:NAD-dependent epimerase/dehydratase family protein [Micromonospora sp. M12]